jgi:hypothetical protein
MVWGKQIEQTPSDQTEQTISSESDIWLISALKQKKDCTRRFWQSE